MTKAQERLRQDIEKITDEAIIEKVKIFIMGILAQQSITEQQDLFNAHESVSVEQVMGRENANQ